MSVKIKKYYPLTLTLTLLIFLYFLTRNIPEENVRLFLNRLGPWGPVGFILLKFSTDVFAPVSATPLNFAGFYLFGSYVIFFSVFATFLSTTVNFWIARRWGRGIVEKIVGHKYINKIDKLSQNHGLIMLFLLRVFLGGVGDFISYAAGLTPLRFSSYLIVSILGMIPGTLLWYLIASKINDPLVFTISTIFLVLILSSIFILLDFIFNRWKK